MQSHASAFGLSMRLLQSSKENSHETRIPPFLMFLRCCGRSRLVRDDQIRNRRPIIFAETRTKAFPALTATSRPRAVLTVLRREGFQPVHGVPDRGEATRIRVNYTISTCCGFVMRASQWHRGERIILLHSHDGTSCIEMLRAFFRFVLPERSGVAATLRPVRFLQGQRPPITSSKAPYEVLHGFRASANSRDAMVQSAHRRREADGLPPDRR